MAILKTKGPPLRNVQPVSNPGESSTTRVVSFFSGGLKGDVRRAKTELAEQNKNSKQKRINFENFFIF
jgi:hypothetical protein